MAKEVCFIVVTFNPDCRRLQKLINSLKGYSVVIVDNTEKYENSLQTLIKDKKFIVRSDIELISIPQNHGYAAAINSAMGKAPGFPWHIILNDDIELNPQAVNIFLDKLLALPPSVAGVFKGSLDKRRWSTIYSDLNTGSGSNDPDYVSGEFFAVHRDVYEAVGNFFEPYFLYYEEVDFCRRAVNAGFPIKHIDVAGIRHKHKEIPDRLGKCAKEYYLARNHLLFVERLAPFTVKVHELLRILWTYRQHLQKAEFGALAGVKSYVFRRFGKLKEGIC